MIKDDKGKLYENNYQKLSAQTGDEKKKNKSKSSAKDILNIVKLIMAKKYAPAIIFAFSKKEVENLAKNISKNKQMLTKDEASKVESLYKTLLGSISEEDK